MSKLTDRQVDQIRAIIVGYRINALFGQRLNGKPAYGVWFGPRHPDGYPLKGLAERLTDQPLTVREAREVMADLIVGDIIEVLEGE